MADEIEYDENVNKEFFDKYRPAKDAKIDNFDFYEFSEHLTNSITDKLYRSYLPPLETKYRKSQDEGHDDDLSNDFDVDHIVQAIKRKMEANIVDKVASSIDSRVSKELDEQYHPTPGGIEEKLDRFIKWPRYIIAIGFSGLYIIMMCLGVMIIIESLDILLSTYNLAVSFFSNAFDGNYHDILRDKINTIVASTLSVLDLLLVGSLAIMVLVGVSENTIARIGMTHNVPTWFGKLGIGQLKIKVAASIVIISSIHLLVLFLGLDLKPSADPYNYQALMWTAIVHGVFVLSALALAGVEYVNSLAGDSGH